MNAHTPGPLRVETCRSQQRQGCHALYDEQGRELALVWDFPESRANADLYAAAPDMLEALQRIVREDAEGEISIGAIDDAKAAIAKSEGRTL